jgi:hypothetical protein
MTNVRFTQVVWLGTLLGLCGACGAEVRNLGDEGSLGGGGTGSESAGGETSASTETTGGSGATGGAPQATGGTGNAAAAGGSAGSTGTFSCLPYDSHGTAGALLTPPSSGFESGLGNWTTVSGNASSLSWSQGATNACEGSAYLVCNGARRLEAWDGPAIDVLPYLVAGHQYIVTLAARFDPALAPTTSAVIHLMTSRGCTDSSVATIYSLLQEAVAAPAKGWLRLSGTLHNNLSDCAQPKSLLVYVETDAAGRDFSLDVDDIQLWDVTPPT